jgi:hypothetical protein
MEFDWNKDKNILLKSERGIGFEDFLLNLENGKLLDIVPHFNLEKYHNQKLFIIDIDGYTYYVPFVEDNETIFLKNIIPSRENIIKNIRC